jgi:hypothetical protein
VQGAETYGSGFVDGEEILICGGNIRIRDASGLYIEVEKYRENGYSLNLTIEAFDDNIFDDLRSRKDSETINPLLLCSQICMILAIPSSLFALDILWKICSYSKREDGSTRGMRYEKLISIPEFWGSLARIFLSIDPTGMFGNVEVTYGENLIF